MVASEATGMRRHLGVVLALAAGTCAAQQTTQSARRIEMWVMDGRTLAPVGGAEVIFSDMFRRPPASAPATERGEPGFLDDEARLRRSGTVLVADSRGRVLLPAFKLM